MGLEDIPEAGWIWFVLVALALLNLYNTVATARRNAREEKRERDSPTKALEERIADHDKKLERDKRRLDEHEEQLADIKKGLMANSIGVQSLIEHELHDGNTEKMERASERINEWLTTRP